MISLCPPAIAEDVAGEVAASGFDGRLRRGERDHAGSGRADRGAPAAASDGCVIARTGVNLYLSGDPEDVAAVAALFPESDVNAIPLEGGVGAASALKMAFGGWNKIGVALAAQAHAIARAYGVEDALAGEGVESDRILRAAPKAWRWAPEMEEVAATCARARAPRRHPHTARPTSIAAGMRTATGPAELDRLLDDLGQAPATSTPSTSGSESRARSSARPGRGDGEGRGQADSAAPRIVSRVPNASAIGPTIATPSGISTKEPSAS